MSRLKRLIHAIHERSLWQILVVYLGVSWGVLEAADLFAQRLGPANWLFWVALGLLVVGLVVLLALAFLPEPAVSPTEPHELHLAGHRRQLLTWRRAATVFVVALAAWGVVATGWLLLHERGQASIERKSLAVLPFENLSPDPEDAYFTDGIHEEIISQLTRIADLKVISRTSVMAYEGRSGSVRRIAEELGVTNILEGTVRRAGGRVRITTQLVNAQEDEHLWAGNYERDLADVFAIQADVAQRVASAVGAALTSEELHRIRVKPTDNSDAYDLYLRGRTLRRSCPFDEDCLRSAQGAYEQAVELDPSFALAYAGLADVHTAFFHWSHDRTRERLELARAAAERALAFDSELPEAHLAMGSYHYMGFRRYDRAWEEFEIAERGLPGDEQVVYRKAIILKRTGRFGEAVPLYQRAAELSPLDWGPVNELGIIYENLRDYDSAERYYLRAGVLRSDSLGNPVRIGWLRLEESGDTGPLRSALAKQPLEDFMFDRWYVEYRDGRYEEALTVLADWQVNVFESQGGYWPLSSLTGLTLLEAGDTARAWVLLDSARVVLASELTDRMEDYRLYHALGLANAGLGRKEAAIHAGRRALELYPPSRDVLIGAQSVLAMAEIYARVGEAELALDELDRYLAGPGTWSIGGLAGNPHLGSLRDHPRFQALLTKYE